MFSGIALAGERKTTEQDNVMIGGQLEERINPVLYPVRLFRKYISVTDGNRCPMYPTCSQYCIESFRKNGIIMGWIMSCDRIMRCGGNEMDLSSPVWVNGEKHIHDPVSHNDFWWK
jgi:putative component of membrane protein insertase Oxa1/YidC/SpoIIIJ protein YidD